MREPLTRQFIAVGTFVDPVGYAPMAPRIAQRHLQQRPVPPRHLAAKTAAGGALAVGALALGVAALGAFAIGRLVIGKARVRALEIDDLTVRRLHILDADRHARPRKSG